MSAYPRNLSYFVKRLANYSRNTYRLQTLNTNTASASQIITVDLPNNSLVDLSTLTWYFEGSTSVSGTVSSTNCADFPRNVETLIERLEIEVNGQLISPGAANYAQLWQIISDTTMGEDCTNRRSIMQKSLNYLSAPTTIVANVPFTIVNWLGFLGSAQPTVLDTNLLGNVRLRITLSPATVLVAPSTSTSPNFSLGNMYFSCDCISIDDGIYYNLHDQFLSKGGIYEIPFNNFFSFSSPVSASGDGSVKFSLSSTSLNQLWATFVYGSGGATPTVVDASDVTTGSTTGIGTSYGFLRSALGISGYQFNINNQYVPNYRPSRDMAYTLLMNAYGLSQDTVGGVNKNINTLANWRNRYWVCSCSLDHAVSADERFISGLNTLGNVAQGYFEYQNASLSTASTPVAGGFGGAGTVTSCTCLVFAQTTCVLQIGAGRQIQLVP